MTGKTCPPVTIGSCASVAFTVDSGGGGSLASGQLSIDGAGSLSGCGFTYPLTFAFVGTKVASALVGTDEGATVREATTLFDSLGAAALF
jgi:hypothetical protein